MTDVERLVTEALGARIVPPPDDPMAVARAYIADRYGELLLRHHRGVFYQWDGTCWPDVDDGRVRSDLSLWLEDATYWKPTTKDGSPELVRFKPTRNKIVNVVEALRAIGYLNAALSPPVWLTDVRRPPAAEHVSMANGILHLPSRTMISHTPEFFAAHALPFAYQPRATTPTRWLRFLSELWPDDVEQIEVLGELFGYVLSGATRQQKLFMVTGPTRSGKGTIARVLTGLLGAHNVAGPTLASLTSNFGLSPLIGKPLAVVSDARLSGRSDRLVAVERLLSISGEDALTIDRKYLDPWTGTLPTRFLILSNELPRLTDSSGALAGRFVLFTLRENFYGREDPNLTEALLVEAPGIFNWALDGLDRLSERGYFVRPAASEDAIQQLEDLASPIAAFIRDRCELDADYEVDKNVLYRAWVGWCELEGQARPAGTAMFGRDLFAADPRIAASRPRGSGDEKERRRVYTGIRLKDEL